MASLENYFPTGKACGGHLGSCPVITSSSPACLCVAGKKGEEENLVSRRQMWNKLHNIAVWGPGACMWMIWGYISEGFVAISPFPNTMSSKSHVHYPHLSSQCAFPASENPMTGHRRLDFPLPSTALFSLLVGWEVSEWRLPGLLYFSLRVSSGAGEVGSLPSVVSSTMSSSLCVLGCFYCMGPCIFCGLLL